MEIYLCWGTKYTAYSRRSAAQRVLCWADVSARGACDSSPGKSICCRQQCRKEEGGRMKHHKERFVVVPIPIVSGGSGAGADFDEIWWNKTIFHWEYALTVQWVWVRNIYLINNTEWVRVSARERENTFRASAFLSFSLRPPHKTAICRGCYWKLARAHCAHINFKDKIFIILIIKRERGEKRFSPQMLRQSKLTLKRRAFYYFGDSTTAKRLQDKCRPRLPPT